MKRGKYERNKGWLQWSQWALWQKVLVIVLAVVLVLAAVVVCAVNHVLGKLGSTDDLSGTVSTDDYYETVDKDSIDGTMETLTDDDVEFDYVEALKGEGVINILLIGQDARDGEVRARSDTMIVVTLNLNKNAIQMTSFMRDTYVQIPGWANNKLNTPFRFEGVDLLNETILLNFGLEIDGDVVVNFEDFKTIVDIVGGVDITLTSEEASYLNKRGCSVQAGENHLDGTTALEYCRIRKIGGDYARTERQRNVLTAIAGSLVDSGVSGLTTLINEILPLVSTNLSTSQIISYASAGLSMLIDGAPLQTLRIPADDAHFSAMINGMSVLVPDLAACREDLQEFIYSE